MTDTQILPTPPTALLKAVHNQMKELFIRYNALALEESWAKKAVVDELQAWLHIHMEIEETLFYPAVQNMRVALAVSVVLNALKVHREIKGFLAELLVLSLDHGSLDAKMGELQSCVLPHLQVEETEIFPHARALPDETQRDLSRAMERMRIRLQGRP